MSGCSREGTGILIRFILDEPDVRFAVGAVEVARADKVVLG